MTFFLESRTAPPTIPVDNSRVDLESSASTWATMGAAITSAQLENDANFVARRRYLSEKASRTWEAANRIGIDAISDRAREQGIPEPAISAFSAMMARRPDRMHPQLEAIVQDMAGTAARENPEAWVDNDMSEEALQTATNERLRGEYEDAQAILDMMPGGQLATKLIGGMVGMTADIKNIPFLLAGGGGGSIARVIGREAFLNMSAEAAFMPAQFEMAERLDIPDPDIPTQLALAAIAGGVIGGVTEAGVRGVTYWRGRNRIAAETPLAEIEAVDAIEDILTADRGNPFEAVDQVLDALPPRPVEPSVRFEGAGAVGGRTANVTFPDAPRTASVDVNAALQSNEVYQAARAQNPAVFERLERLKDQQRRLRGWMDDLRGKQVTKEEAVAVIDERIADLEAQHRATQGKTNKKRIREQIAEARADRDAALATRDTESPDERLVRRQLVDIDETLRDLAPEIGAAYRASGGPRQGPELALPARDEPAVDFEAFVADMTPPVAAPRVQEAPQRASQAVTEAAPRADRTIPAKAFDDVQSKEAADMREVVISEWRAEVDATGGEEMRIELPDGTILNSEAEVLAFMDEADQFADDVAVCLIGGATQ